MRHNIREQLRKMNILTALLNYNFRIGMLIGKNTFEALIPKGCLLQVGREIESFIPHSVLLSLLTIPQRRLF